MTCKNLDGNGKSVFFVFAELCVKVEGSYRLKFVLSRLPKVIIVSPKSQNISNVIESKASITTTPSSSPWSSTAVWQSQTNRDGIDDQKEQCDPIGDSSVQQQEVENGDEEADAATTSSANDCTKSTKLATVISDPFISYSSRSFPGIVGKEVSGNKKLVSGF